VLTNDQLAREFMKVREATFCEYKTYLSFVQNARRFDPRVNSVLHLLDLLLLIESGKNDFEEAFGRDYFKRVG